MFGNKREVITSQEMLRIQMKLICLHFCRHQPHRVVFRKVYCERHFGPYVTVTVKYCIEVMLTSGNNQRLNITMRPQEPYDVATPDINYDEYKELLKLIQKHCTFVQQKEKTKYLVR